MSCRPTLAGDLQRPNASTGRCSSRASGCIADRRRRFAGHLDLLPVARQLWKHRTGNARLATVEEAVCAVARYGDLPGALIPERYFGYLRSRRGELLRDVVDHNRQDIVSLGLLLPCWWGRVARALAAAHPGDLAGLARGFVRAAGIEDA